MKPNKIGQIVRYHTTFPDEDPNQLYVVLEIFLDVEKPRCLIKELNNSLQFASTSTRFVEDLEVSMVGTKDLYGQYITINKPDNSQKTGSVINVNQEHIMLHINKTTKGVETNVWLTIKDEIGMMHSGTLYVKTA